MIESRVPNPQDELCHEVRARDREFSPCLATKIKGKTWVLRIKGKPAELCLPKDDPFLKMIKSAIPSLELQFIEKELG